ncbi:MAG: LCP family protein [Anaerolineaceae bacterium]|jgi:LCP family protein required for cell wall assembly
MKKIYVRALFLLAIVLVAATVWGIFAAYARPLGPRLEISQNQPAAMAAAGLLQANPPQASEVCGQSGKLRLLALGSDRAQGVQPFGADGVRFIQVDFSNRKVTIAAFSRDLEVKIFKGLADKSIKRTPLGLSYHLKYIETAGSDKDKAMAATNFMAELLYDNYKLRPDHYLAVELQHFDSLVDAVGGITIHNPSAFVSDNGTHFAAGSINLTGELAAEYMRTFEPGGDMARLQRQNVVMKGLREKLVAPGVVLNLAELYERFGQVMLTDLSLEQFNSLDCILREVPKEEIKTYEIGPDERVIGPDGKVIEQPKSLQAILNNLFKD